MRRTNAIAAPAKTATVNRTMSVSAELLNIIGVFVLEGVSVELLLHIIGVFVLEGVSVELLLHIIGVFVLKGVSVERE